MQCAGRSHFSCTGEEIKRFSVVDVEVIGKESQKTELYLYCSPWVLFFLFPPVTFPNFYKPERLASA